MGVQDNVVNTAQPYINYIYKRHKNTQCQQLYSVYFISYTRQVSNRASSKNINSSARKYIFR
jgi:hypothetical protein